jgi:hypothetical protein
MTKTMPLIAPSIVTPRSSARQRLGLVHYAALQHEPKFVG